MEHTFVYFSTYSPLTLRHLYLGTSFCIPSSYHVAAWLFNQHPSGLHRLRSVYQQSAPSFLETGTSPTVPGPDCTEDARRCLSGIYCSRSKACVCLAACERALSCNRTIPRETLPLLQDNLKSHWPAENE